MLGPWRAPDQRPRRGRKRLMAAVGTVGLLSFAADWTSVFAAAPAADTTTLLSRPDGTAAVPAPGTGAAGLALGAGTSSVPGGQSTSDDGRYVVFVSNADDLSTEDNDNVENVYRRDTVDNITTLVSRATGAAGAAGTSDAVLPVISDDGTKVAFVTTAPLDPVNDAGSSQSVYLRDLVGNTTALVSTLDGPPAPGNSVDVSPEVSIDGDGSHVAFATFAAIDPADTDGQYDVHVRDVVAETSENVTPEVGSAFGGFSLSDDGRKVAFRTPLVLDAADTNGMDDIYVRDLDAPATALASRETGAAGPVGTSLPLVPRLSGDGKRVAFLTSAALDPANDTNGQQDVYVRDVTSNATARASVDTGGAQFASSSADPTISDDGKRIGFYESGSSGSLRVRTLGAGADTQTVSRATGAAGTLLQVSSPDLALAGDGKSATFALDEDNASPDDDDTFRHVYQRRLPDNASAGFDDLRRPPDRHGAVHRTRIGARRRNGSRPEHVVGRTFHRVHDRQRPRAGRGRSAQRVRARRD